MYCSDNVILKQHNVKEKNQPQSRIKNSINGEE